MTTIETDCLYRGSMLDNAQQKHDNAVMHCNISSKLIFTASYAL